MKKISIVFFGDSVCFGQGISINKGWITKIANNLDNFGLKNHINFNITNAGVNGNTTRLALERMFYDILSHQFDILIIQFGLNDCNYWKTDKGLARVSPKCFEANLLEILDRAKRFGIKKQILNTNHPTTRTQLLEYANSSYQENNKRYNEIIRQVAAKRKSEVLLVDVEKQISIDKIKVSSLLQPDGLHLNEKGHLYYYNLVYPKLKLVINQIIK